MRSRTKEELIGICKSILQNDPWDNNAVHNSAVRLAELFMELTGNVGVEYDDEQPRRQGPDQRYADYAFLAKHGL